MTKTLNTALVHAIAAQPWAMDRLALDAMLARLTATDVTQARAPGGDEAQAAMTPAAERAVARKEGQVAVIQIRGVIASRQSFMDWLMDIPAVPPAAIVNAVEAAMADPAVKAVVMVWDSPGGSPAGVPEAHARLMALRGQGKPLISHASGQCGSAAYWMATAADAFYAEPTAMVGSIGVYQGHMDASGAYAQAGLNKTYIEAPKGGNKTEGHDAAPLDEAATAHIQELVDDIYSLFTRDVAAGRAVSEAVVKSETYGQGRAYLGTRAAERGLVDKVRTFTDLVASLGGTSPAAPQGRGRAYAQAQARLRGIASE